jgi:ribonuclease HII
MPSHSSWPAEQLALSWAAHGDVAGVDEAGRGPLAGPVVAAAVILDSSRPVEGLADSKTLTAARRERLDALIRERARAVAIGEASVQEIDSLNILQATLLAMRRAVEALRPAPGRVLVDGNRLPALAIPARAIVRGDATVAVISAASVLAKVHRDRLCAELDRSWPAYGFAEHKGYPTASHLQALTRHGACPAHRRSFAPVRAALARAASA